MSVSTKETRSRSNSLKSGGVLAKKQVLHRFKADILFFSVMLACGFYPFQNFQ